MWGYLKYLGPYLISYYSKVQNHVATSSSHAELCEISRGSRNALFLKNFLEDMGFMQDSIEVHTDSLSAINATAKLTTSDAAKHYAVLINEVREYRENEMIVLKKAIGEDNVADLMTNQRGKVKFQHLVNLMHNPLW